MSCRSHIEPVVFHDSPGRSSVLHHMELTNSASESVPGPNVTSLINLNPPGQALPNIAIFGPSITPNAVEAVLIALDGLKKGGLLGIGGSEQSLDRKVCDRHR